MESQWRKWESRWGDGVAEADQKLVWRRSQRMRQITLCPFGPFTLPLKRELNSRTVPARKLDLELLLLGFVSSFIFPQSTGNGRNLLSCNR